VADVSFSKDGPPETILPAPEPESIVVLDRAVADTDPAEAVARVIADHPRFLHAWAAAGELAESNASTHRARVEAHFLPRSQDVGL
jgi:hypothetical protein